jgi:LuxR family maltose regulon positive regulatory protein
VDKAITFLLDHLPTQMHLAIATRIDPSLPLSRLRARGQMTEIRADDLRFSTDEAAAFLNQIMGLALPNQDVAALEARTEGWITGLQLAALSMQGSDDVRGFVRSFTGSNRYILDYLGEEVFSYQPPNRQDFLLKTSVLSRLTGSLCDAITGSSDGEHTLASLEKGNLFIIPLDNERRWYRYHHLFADLLGRRLNQTHPELVPMLHSQASDWYAHHDFQFEAVHHALAGNNFEKAADLIEANGLRLIGQGAFTPLQKWINNLPEPIVRKRPYLCVYHAWASSFTHQVEGIESYLRDAQRALQALEPPADDHTSKSLVGHIATLRAWNARRRRDNSLAISLLKDAVESLGDGNPFVRTFADLNLGLAYMDDGELVKAADALRNAVSQGNASENELASLMATSHLAAILILQGRLHEAAKLCRQTIRDQLARHEKPPPTLCMIYLRLGWVLAEWNDIDGFYANLAQAVILADQIGYDSVVTAGSRAMAWEQELLAEQGTTVELSEDVAQITDRVLSGETNPLPIQTQNIDIYLGDDSYFEIWPGYSDHARARKLAEEGNVAEALHLLAQIYRSAQAVEGIGLMIEARVREALIYQSQGDMNHALASLGDALSLGEPEGYIRTFVDRESPMAQLLSEAAARGIMPDYARRLLAAFSAGEQDEPRPSPQALVEPLSEREVEILQLIAQGLSNREIGERLFIALDTVKGHNHRIFGKLGVHRRTKAVDQARKLGLL